MSTWYVILVPVVKMHSVSSVPGGMAELVDAADLKSVEGNTSWEFKSPYPHFTLSLLVFDFTSTQSIRLHFNGFYSNKSIR